MKDEMYVKEFLSVAIPYIAQYGYTKGETRSNILTKFDTLEKLKDDHDIDLFIDWVNSKTETDYIRSVKDVLNQETIKSWQYNILCSAVNSWRKSIESKKSAGLSNFVGEIGDKITFKVKEARILSTKYFGYYGSGEYNFYRMVGEDNNIYLWGTSAWVEEGDTISGTVKAFKEYNGEKQTVITKGHIIDGKRYERGLENFEEDFDPDEFVLTDLIKDLYGD